MGVLKAYEFIRTYYECNKTLIKFKLRKVLRY